ncbi:glycosyltransferase family 4 protein [Marinobacter sp. DUT-3]|uniref:glycosyltransferase family 4 protein n=1 Tax=Marinobacter sp. DUT-3 TaxID=3412036 RepID=UPI003D16F400
MHREVVDISRVPTPVHVLLVVRWPIGGIRTYLKYVLSNIPASKIRFSIIVPDIGESEVLYDDIHNKIYNWHTYRVSKKGGYLDFFKVIRRVIREDKVELVHAHGFTSMLICVPALLFSWCPLIFTSHDVLNQQQFRGFWGRVKRLLLRFGLSRCEKIQSVSSDAQDNLVNYFPKINKDKLEVNLNGIEVDRFNSPKAVDLRAELNIDSDKIVVGFFGRFMAQKGFRFLVEAIEILKREESSPEFHVVCFGSGAFIREEKADIIRRGLNDDFTFAPFIPDVSGSMKGCNMIVMPSLWEACPLQPMEALCAGVPFVGSDCIGLREVLAGTPAIQVKSGDADSLARGILSCLEVSRDTFEEYAPIALERFDVRKTAEGIHALYERALA